MSFWDIFNKQEPPKKDTKSPNSYVVEQQKYRAFETTKTLEDAIAEAENIHNPHRYLLNRIYDDIEMDPHLSSQWENRKMKTIQREWGFFRDGELDEDITKLIDSDWFYKFLNLALDSKLRGNTVITFGKWNGEKFDWSRGRDGKIYEPVRLINPDHIIPEKGLLIKNIYDNTGLDLFKPPFSSNTVFVGEPQSFGFLRKCAKYILFKNNCLANWSEFAEVFGLDMRIGKTSATGAARTGFINMLKQLGSGGFGLMNEDDEIVFAGTSRTDAYQVYKELNEYVDKNVSKVIFGQDVISDMSGKTRGTAAEEVTETYAENDAKFLKGIVNDILIDKLINMGVSIEGVSFDWVTTEDIDLTERADIDTKISQMGFALDAEYITRTYGVELVEETEEAEGGELPEIFQYHIENGIVNKNEVRERLKLAPDESVKLGEEAKNAEISRKLQVMKAGRDAGVDPEQAALLAGFKKEEAKKLSTMSEVGDSQKVSEELKNLYDGL